MTYVFDEFRLRPATPADLPLATAWTAADPDHAGRTIPAFWIAQSSEINSFLLVRWMQPVFFFRIDERPAKQIEVHIQFSSAQALRERITRRGITEGFKWLETMLTDSGFEGYYFHSRNAPLIFFCQNRLGFEWDGTKLYRNLRKSYREPGAVCSEPQPPLLDSLLGEGASATILGG